MLTVFVAIYIKSKIFIGLELLISFRNTVTASMKNISAMNDGEPFRPFPISSLTGNRNNDSGGYKRPRDEGR